MFPIAVMAGDDSLMPIDGVGDTSDGLIDDSNTLVYRVYLYLDVVYLNMAVVLSCATSEDRQYLTLIKH